MSFLLKGCSVHRQLPHVTANAGKKHEIIFPLTPKCHSEKCSKNSEFDEHLNVYNIQESDFSENKIFDIKGTENCDQENDILLTKQCDDEKENCDQENDILSTKQCDDEKANCDQENNILLTKQCDILKTGEQGYDTDSTQYTAISGFGPGFDEIKVCFFVLNL